MVFSSNVFLFLFLPLFLAIYYLTPDRYRLRNWVVLAGSYAFYAWWRVDFLVLFTAVTAWNYFVGLAMVRAGIDTPAAKRWLIAGITVDLAVLAYFKYANFGVASFNAMLGSIGMEPMAWTSILLPIGISFYIFESISYIMDVYRRDTEPTRHPVDFFTFVALFPHLVAGPVLRYKDLAHQFTGRTHTVDKFTEGAVRFMQGFIKKVFIADSIAPMVSAGFALENPSTADAWITAMAYTAQLYFDFSGYSDMAIGLGLMMGFRFMENFNQPYISQSITEFWRRWHISLSSWLRDYLYVPLGGNRGGTLKTYRNLWLTMVLGGLWHGANWTFVLWGIWHGTILAIERLLGVATDLKTPWKPLRWAITFLLVVIGWVMFRADSVGDAMRFYAAMFSFDSLQVSEVFASNIDSLQLTTLALAFVVVAWSGWRSRNPSEASLAAVQGIGVRGAVLGAVMLPLFALAVLKLSAQSYSPFLYFQF
jgi:alginate O-acetyltransferase complex protein AlgI